jgi:rubrerythrin
VFERLQRLLHDLQERAALKDFVTTSLDQKADASDLRALLSKDELDSTAQSIINQLQELINRQAAHEQSMGEHLKEVGQEVDHRTKDDDFNRFSEEIEKRLRALRKKIEKAGAGGLRDLATEAGAAGFRKQLFNCISCDKDLYMRITNPLLPSPSAFPARMSLRPHTAYDTKHVRAQARGDPSDLLDPIKRENTSDYNTLLVEKELERRRKMKENKIRQEISGYNFKSGSIPRQVGGNRQVIYDRGARQEELRHAMGTEYETADLEGVDGHLYKGRVKKLPNLVRKTLDKEDLNRIEVVTVCVDTNSRTN